MKQMLMFFGGFLLINPDIAVISWIQNYIFKAILFAEYLLIYLTNAVHLSLSLSLHMRTYTQEQKHSMYLRNSFCVIAIWLPLGLI